jgi:hypothetical protein
MAAVMERIAAEHARQTVQRPGRQKRTAPGIGRPDAQRPDVAWVRRARWLALALALVVGLSIVPVAWQRAFNLETAPGWARAILLAAALQAVYIAWMLNYPDWASVWIVTLVFALGAAAYATVMAMAMATPLDRSMPLGMDDVRRGSAAWCAAALGLMSLATYLCGRTSVGWRRHLAAHQLQRGVGR